MHINLVYGDQKDIKKEVLKMISKLALMMKQQTADYK